MKTALLQRWFDPAGSETINTDAGIQDDSEASDFDPGHGIQESDLYSGFDVFQPPKPSGSEAMPNHSSDSSALPNRTVIDNLSQSCGSLFNSPLSVRNSELGGGTKTHNISDVKGKNDVKDMTGTSSVKTSDIRDRSANKGYLRNCDIEIKRVSGTVGVGVWTKVPIEAGRTIGPCPVNNRGGISQPNPKDPEKTEWMTLIRPVTNTEASNLMAVQLQNQLYYRAIREIQAGEEMLLYTKDRLYPQKDMDFDKVDNDLNSATCVNCGEVFQSKSALQAHQTYACRPPSPSYTDKDVDTTEHGSFRSGDGVRSPVEECDPQEAGEFKCEECPRSFALKSNLARHQITHESGRRFACEHCDRCFTDPSNLQRHIRSQHHGARCHACVDCGKTFATSSGLKQHQHIHSSVKPFQCEVCLKAYTQFSNLCRHKRMHADCRQQIKCTDCGQAFSTITSLSKHKRFCEGALRSGIRIGGYGGDAKSLGTTGLQHAGPTTPFNPALMMGLYGARPPFPFYQPMGSNFAGLFPAGHPLAALTALSPGSMRSSAFSFTPTKTESSSPSKFEGPSGMSRPSEGLSDGASEVQSGSDLDNIPSDSESEHSYERKSSEMKSNEINIEENKPDIDIVKSKTPELSHSVPAILSQPHPHRFTPRSSPGVLNPSPSPSSLTKEEPFDLSKTYKSDQITPKTSPTIETTTSGEQPLDLSSTKELTPPEAPRKTHIFGDPKTPDTTGQRLHYAYPQLTSSMMMEQALRMSEKKEKSPESTGFLPYTRFPFTSPSQYSVGVNPFSLVMNREPVKPLQPPSFSPVGKSPVSPYQYTSPSQYSTLSSSQASPNKSAKDKYSCKFCGKVFPRSANLTRHLRTHTGEQPYKCKYCERSFSISSNLQRHVRNIHNKEKPFRCALCDRCFGQQTNLDRHLKKHETDGMNLPDSPENETESTELDDKDESYFAEIRNFIGKATERGMTDINQNSLSLSEMKARFESRMGQMAEPRADSSLEDENDQELDVGGPGDLNETGTDGSENGDVENDIEQDKGEPATKRSRLANRLLMNSYTQDTALPLCKTPTFELERNFSI